MRSFIKYFFAYICLCNALQGQSKVILQLPNISAEVGNILSYPININPNQNTVAAISFNLYYDPAMIEAVDYVSLSSWTQSDNLEEQGRARVNGTNLNGEDSEFTLGAIKFRIIGPSGGLSPISMTINVLSEDGFNDLPYETIIDGYIIIGTDSDNNCNIIDGPLNGLFESNYSFRAPSYLISPELGNKSIATAEAKLNINAGNYVDLNPGFLADYGSNIIIQAANCVEASKIKEKIKINQTTKAKNDLPHNRGPLNSQPVSYIDLSVSPNPISEKTYISYSLETKDIISLLLFNSSGELISKLEDNISKEAGDYNILINRNNLAQGVYSLKLITSISSSSKNLIVIK